MPRNLPLTVYICALKKNKESSGERLSGRGEVKEKKGSTLCLTPGGERKSSHTKRIMHGVTKVSSREETDKEKKQEEAVELLLVRKDLWDDDKRGGPGSSLEDGRMVLRAKRREAAPSSP